MKKMGRADFDALHLQAKSRARQRVNHNMHPVLSDPVQRLFNAIQPNSYVQPHRHHGDDAWESFVLIEGAGAALTFHQDGRVKDRAELTVDGLRLVEIPPGVYHAVVATCEDTLFFELKRGPYNPHKAKDFAEWAPPEGAPECASFYAWMIQARPGEGYAK